MERDEDRTLARLKAHRREFIEPLIAEYQGRVVKLMGDGALVEFASVVDAVRCAVLIQQGMAEREAAVPEAERIRFRIGIDIVTLDFPRWAYEGRLVDLSDALGPLATRFDRDAIEDATLLDGTTGRRGLYALPMGQATN